MHKKERGSIEVVILVIVFAVVIGLIFWRYTEAEKAQQDAENAVNSSDVTPVAPTNKKVEVPEMSLAFEVPQDAGEITYTINESGAVQLMSSKLVDRSDCEVDHDGKFALLRTANEGDANVDDKLKMMVGNVEYVVQEDYQTCYTEADRTEFDEVSQKIAQSLTRLNTANGNDGAMDPGDPDQPARNEEQ